MLNGRKRKVRRAASQRAVERQLRARKIRRQVAAVVDYNRKNAPEPIPLRLTRHGTLVPRQDSCINAEVLQARTVTCKRDGFALHCDQGFSLPNPNGIRRIPEKNRQTAI